MVGNDPPFGACLGSDDQLLYHVFGDGRRTGQAGRIDTDQIDQSGQIVSGFALDHEVAETVLEQPRPDTRHVGSEVLRAQERQLW